MEQPHRLLGPEQAVSRKEVQLTRKTESIHSLEWIGCRFCSVLELTEVLGAELSSENILHLIFDALQALEQDEVIESLHACR